MLTGLLIKLGLMTRAEHERIVQFLSRDDWKGVALDFEAKYKAAITDLAAARDEIELLKDSVEQAVAQADTLRPIAEKAIAKAARDAERKREKRRAGK